MYSRKLMYVMSGMLVCALVAGCSTVRRVDYGETSSKELMGTMRNAANAPIWATGHITGDSTLDHKEYAYFIGISQEQATGEHEAVQQAYLDALARVSDALSLRFRGDGQVNSGSDTRTKGKWPNHLRMFRGTTRDYKRSQNGQWENEEKSGLIRDTVIALASIADTWVVREYSQPIPNVANAMKYEELWKAKVLIRIPRKELATRMARIYELENSGIDFDIEISQAERRLELDITVREVEVHFASIKAGAEMEHRRQMQELAIEKAEAEARLAPMPQPTFHFMNNSYWHGYGPNQGNVNHGAQPIKIEVQD